jgi:putative PIN family toxin of toxin-antitoxin system
LGKKKVTGPANQEGPGGTNAPRVVFDTNVLVSALLFSGPPNRLVALWQEKRIVFLVSKDTLLEYYRVPAYPKFGLAREEIKDLIAESVLPYVETVTVGLHAPVIREDPADDKFLFLAVDGRAEAIISGDKHLLSLGTYRGIEILPVRRFLELIQKDAKSAGNW